jgi:hypothetical protein
MPHSPERPELGVLADMLAWSEELQIVTVPVVRTADRREFICVVSREALEALAGAPAQGADGRARDGFDRDACLAALRHGQAHIAAIAQAKIALGAIGIEGTIRITREDTAARAAAAD